MTPLFGTDGIRGTANADLTADLALGVGQAVGRACREGVLGPPSRRPSVIVGRDTRPSGEMLEAAITAGLCAAGADVLRAGILPTPGVAFLTEAMGVDAGVVLSASHNPAPDNGIKVFGPGGWKLEAGAEAAIESLMDQEPERPTGAGIGRVRDLDAPGDTYVDHLVASVDRTLQGLRVVADLAHGAAFRVAPEALRRAGATVTELHGEPDGERINDGCGATRPEVVARAAARDGAIGLTFDGDADRVLAADEHGRVVDGDAILAVLARSMRRAGRLKGDAIVSTVMANQAFRRWCGWEKLRFVETPVGDRHVLQTMRDEGSVLGGEQSGHVILLDHATTGDGTLTALHLLSVVAAEGGRLADLVPFEPLPQVLVNVRTSAPKGWDAPDAVRDALRAAEERLGADGRILVRPSGTEPLVRVMVEAPTEQEARDVAESVAGAVRGSVRED